MQAFDFILQALNDYAMTLAPSARAAFIAHANAAATEVKKILDSSEQVTQEQKAE